MNQPNSWDIGGDAGNSFQFDQIGASVTGTILSLAEVQQTNITTGEPEFWPGGQPKMMYRVGLATALRDPANPMDDGRRDVYLKGSRKPESLSSLAAVLAAVKAATGGTNMEPNATLTLTYVGDGQAERGKSAPKQYKAAYLRPPMNLGGQQAAQQPVYQPPQVPQATPVYQQPQQQAPVVQQPVYQPQQAPQAATAPQAVAPVPQAAPAPQVWPWTDASLAAVRAAGADPAQVWPAEWAAYLAQGGR